MSGSVTIIDGISNAGKTTFCDYMKTHGYFIIEEAPVFLKNNKNIGTLSATVPNNLEEEKKNQEVLFEAEIERLKMAEEYAKNGKNVIMDRSFLSTVAMAYALEKDLPFKGAYDYSKELEKKYFKDIQNLSKIVNINFLFFDVNRDILIERNQKRNNILSSEWIKDDFLKKQKILFLSSAKSLNAKIIDTSYLTLDNIAKIIYGENYTKKI